MIHPTACAVAVGIASFAPCLATAQGAGGSVPSPTPIPTAPADPVDPGAGPVRSASARCNDFTIRFIEADVAQPYPQFPVGGGPVLDPGGARAGGREMTAQFMCHNDGGFTLPNVTSMHLLEVRDGRLCHRVRSCGNLRHVGGYFGISIGWSQYTSVSKFMVSSDFARQTTNYDGLSVTLSAYVNFEQFERYCSTPSEPVCI